MRPTRSPSSGTGSSSPTRSSSISTATRSGGCRPRRADRLKRVVVEEWGGELIRGWDHWLDEPLRVGDRLAEAVLGAGPGEVVVSDSTSVNFYKAALAALEARPGRRVVVTDRPNFPTDRYVLEGLARARDLRDRLARARRDRGSATGRCRGGPRRPRGRCRARHPQPRQLPIRRDRGHGRDHAPCP